MSNNDSRAATLELSTIQPIASDQRHGRARDLFTIWFGSNIMLLTVVTGALAVTVFKLPFMAAMVALILGNLIGGIFMALHSAQGPQLGVPQMVQTRGQFGSYGSLLVVALVVIMYLGFFASNLVLGGQSLHSRYPLFSTNQGIVLVGLISVVATVFGYRLIHAYTRLMSYLSGAILLLCFAWIIAVHGLPADFLQRNETNLAGFLGTLSIAALWQLAYAPYVSDYSRYMPADTGGKAAFWSSYWGCCLGSILPMALGVIVGLSVEGDIIAGLGLANGWAGVIVHGAIRDSRAIGEMAFGCKALGTNPAKSTKTGAGEKDVPVRFGNVTFQPGGWVYADEDGVLFAPTGAL